MSGGDAPKPTYESVCAGDGHTEAIRIVYDPSKVEFDELLKHFWKVQDPGSKAKAPI